jgi:hypothetical protein
VHVSPKPPHFTPYPTVHAVAGHDEVGRRQLRQARHLPAALELHPQAGGPIRQDVEQVLPLDAVAVALAR